MMKKFLSILALLILYSGLKADSTTDSLKLVQRIEDGAKKVEFQKALNRKLFQQGRISEMQFLVNLNDRISDTLISGNEKFITEAGLEQQLNDSLREIFTRYGLETYLIFANYFELKIQARIPNGVDSVKLTSLFKDSTWYNANSNIDVLNQKSQLIYSGILNKLQGSLQSNVVLISNMAWNVLYLENKGKRFYTYTLGYSLQNIDTTESKKTITYFRNIDIAYRTQYAFRPLTDRNTFAKDLVKTCSRAAWQIQQSELLLSATNSNDLNNVLQGYENNDYYALTVKQRLHALRVYIRNSYNESIANKIIGIVPSLMMNEFYDSLKTNLAVNGTQKIYLYYIIDETSGNDLDQLFKYFVRNFPYYYKNRASEYTDESSYEIINLKTNPTEPGDCELMDAYIGQNGSMFLKYRAITDITTSVTKRQTSDNTAVAGAPPASDDDYCIQHPEDCTELNVPDWHEFPENNVIDVYFPVLLSYEGEDEDVNATLQGTESALVPAIYLYYLKNEADKQKIADNVASAVEITVQVVAIVGTDGAAAPLFLGGTRFAGAAIKTYRALNYVSLGLTAADWTTGDPSIHKLKETCDAITMAVDLPELAINAPKAWRSIKKISKAKLSAARRVSKQAATNFYNALKNAGGSINSLSATTKKKVMKLYYYLRRERLLDDVAGLASYFNSAKIKGLLDNAVNASGTYIKKVGNKYKIGNKEFAKLNELNEVVINTDLIPPGISGLSDDAILVGTFEGVNYRKQSFATGQRVEDGADDLLVFKGQDGSVVCLNGVNCFVRNTLIKTQAGYKNIQEVKTGDQVLSFNEVAQENEYQTVKRLFAKTVNKLQRIITGTDTIICTPDHKFYTAGKWVKASVLSAGMLLYISDGSQVSISSNHTFDTIATVYNFEVEKNHNYYISTQEILVHNDCAKIGDLVKSNKLSQADVAEFTKDFAGNDAVLNKFSSGELDIADWKSLRTKHPLLAKDELSLKAFAKAKKNQGLQRLGITETMLSSVDGSTQAGFKEIMADLDAFGTKMNQNPSIEFDNLSSIMGKFADGNTQNSQAAQWIVQDIANNASDFAGKKWKFEVGVTNAGGNTSFIDLRSLGPNPKSIEYKWLTSQTVSKEDFVAQFINRDLFDVSNTQLSQVEWRIKGQKLTKAKVVEYMSSVEGRSALGKNKIIEMFDAYAESINYPNQISNVQDIIDFANNEQTWYNLIFK